MKNRQLLLAFALILAVNAFVLVGVAQNRRGAADTTLVLSERELGFFPSVRAENSGVSLRLDWNRYATDAWFDEEKLATLGFDVEAIREKREQSDDFDLPLPRRGYVVLEYAGDAWRAYQAAKESEIERLEQDHALAGEESEQLAFQIARNKENLLSNSRLFAVDAGADPEVLRRNYPDRSRYAIAGAELRVDYGYAGQPALSGSISRLLVDRLHVAKPLQSPLVDLPRRTVASSYDRGTEVSDWQPRYQVTVSWGSRFEPWIEQIELTPAGKAAAQR